MIFTPSYLQENCALFNWTETGIDDRNTVRIIVVKPAQFSDYINHFGRDLPILCLPRDELGIGFARHWILKVAN